MRTRRLERLAVAAITAALAGACDAGAGAPAPSGTQLLAARDVTNPFYWGGSLAFTRKTMVAGGTDQDLWILPADATAPQVALSGIDWSPPVWSSAVLIGDLLITGGSGERYFDRASMTTANLLTVDEPADLVGPPLAELATAAIRYDGGAVLALRARNDLLVGRAPDFVDLGKILIAGVDFLGGDLAVLGKPNQGPDGTDATDMTPNNLYRVSLPSGDATALPVPPFDPRAPDAGCAAYSGSPCTRFRVIGCRDYLPACAGSGQPPCFIFYERPPASADDATAADPKQQLPYLYDVNMGQEIALPGRAPEQLWLSPDGQRMAWTEIPASQSADTSTLRHYDLCTGDSGMCTGAPVVRLVWRGDGAVLMSLAQAGKAPLMVTFPDGTCQPAVAALNGAVDMQFSPGSTQLLWDVVDPATSQQQIWLGDGMGGGGQMLTSGEVNAFWFSGDGHRVFVARDPGHEYSLGWIDLDDPARTEHVAADAYGGASFQGLRRLLLIDRWSSQDASGTLELLDMETGDQQTLAQAVSDFTIDASVDGAAHVAYVVHGRYGSGQDGLWQTTLPAAAP
jgi:hypothetical protein